MRCPRCQFENMPGLDRCFQCGSVLQIEGTALSVHPPRMPSWKRPIRHILRWGRKYKIIPGGWINIPIPHWAPRIARDEFLGIVLSIVPGLAHFLQKRFREIRWYCLAWIIFLLVSLFFYGCGLGIFFLSLALGLHGYIAHHAALHKVSLSISQRLVILGVMSVYIYAVYWGAGHLLLADLTGANTALDIPYYNISSGDYLLARRGLALEPQPRGALVQLQILRVYNQSVTRTGNDMIGQIIGLPGETVAIKGENFLVNGKQIDSQIYPVPKWLLNCELLFTIPQSSYFVSNAYTINLGHANPQERQRMLETMANQVCVIPKEDIEARAIMRWMPLRKRGFLKDIE